MNYIIMNRMKMDIEADFTSFTDGTYYLRATATDTDNNSLAVERELIIKTVADNVMNPGGT